MPLSNAINAILREWEGKSYGPIPPPSTRPDRENLIFMPNDPYAIESNQLRNDCPQSQRKPDIVGVHSSYLCEVDPKLKNKTLEEIMRMIPNGTIKKNPESPLLWTDVNQPWELKVKDRRLKIPTIKKWTITKLLRDLRKKPDKQSRKRNRGEDSQEKIKPGAKAKSSHRASLLSIHTSIFPDDLSDEEDTLPVVSTKTQCAYYGIERLSCVWHALYSSVVLLEGP